MSPCPAAIPPPLRRPDAFRRALLRWYDRNRRPLPWRTSPSAYRTVVSEFMLQQTQVSTVLPYFEKWMSRFPDFAALASAPVEDVVAAWAGLGYYTRARNLHRLACELAAAGELPRTAAAWRGLPGAGPYTAAAIASIAFGDRSACVDGNVVRVLARLTGDDTSFASGSAAARHFTPLAGHLLDPARPGDANQALMELGATVCTRSRPGCTVCPLRSLCASGLKGGAEGRPRLARPAIKPHTVERIWCVRRGRVLLHRQHGGSRRLAGLHEIPSAEAANLPSETARTLPLLMEGTRTIGRNRYRERIRLLAGGRRIRGADLVWVPLCAVGATPLSGPHRRWAAELTEKHRS